MEITSLSEKINEAIELESKMAADSYLSTALDLGIKNGVDVSSQIQDDFDLEGYVDLCLKDESLTIVVENDNSILFEIDSGFEHVGTMNIEVSDTGILLTNNAFFEDRYIKNKELINDLKESIEIDNNNVLSLSKTKREKTMSEVYKETLDVMKEEYPEKEMRPGLNHFEFLETFVEIKLKDKGYEIDEIEKQKEKVVLDFEYEDFSSRKELSCYYESVFEDLSKMPSSLNVGLKNKKEYSNNMGIKTRKIGQSRH